MPSPFPGMNPYFEQKSIWQDFHDSFIPALRAALAHQVDPYFVVRIEEHLYIREPSAEERLRLGSADVALSRVIEAKKASADGGRTALKVPRRLTISTEFEVEKHLFLEIENRESHEIVTIIELLSPSNKQAGADRDQYITKRRGIFHSHANFVEIDLLRGWEKMPAVEPVVCDYGILVSRYEDRPSVDFWPVSLREQLPTIPVPLRDPILDVTIDLQAILHKVYDEANYRRFIYRGSPYPPLAGDDLTWANAILSSSGISIS